MENREEDNKGNTTGESDSQLQRHIQTRLVFPNKIPQLLKRQLVKYKKTLTQALGDKAMQDTVTAVGLDDLHMSLTTEVF